jgi:hypothetical protein
MVSTRRAASKPSVAASAPALTLNWPMRSDQQSPVVDLFGQAPPNVPTKTVVAPAVTLAPVFNLTYVGRLDDRDNSHAFLADAQERIIVAKVGQAVDNDWQLTAMDAKQLVFRHTVTGKEHTMQIGTLQ